MHSPCVIIGGGVAGLSAAIRLTELGIEPLIIEASTPPSHKVCGEFLSPESLPVLRRWGIDPVLITSAHFFGPTGRVEYIFPCPAGGLSHLQLDPLLIKRAQAGGAIFLSGTTVIELQSSQAGHEVSLSTGERVQTPKLIVATGRLPQKEPKAPRFRYMGIKAHFADLPVKDSLEMFFLNGAYLGISPIEEGKCNLACLARIDLFSGDPNDWILQLRKENRILDQLLHQGSSLFSDWMKVSIPSFGTKQNTLSPHTFFVGDAAGTIPPVTGNGLSMAIESGVLAAEHLVHGNGLSYSKMWRSQFQKSIFWGQLLHQAALRPFFNKFLLKGAQRSPSLINLFYHLTR